MMTATDIRSAYSLKPPTYNAKLTKSDAATPMGELLRRYWHPVGLSGDDRRDAAADQDPRRGADPVPRRARAGGLSIRAAAIAARRSITARSRIAASACCYHGWLFDVEGQCLEIPAEPNPDRTAVSEGAPTWYRPEDRYGLVFAYLGRRRKGRCCRATNASSDGAGEFVEADDSSIRLGRIDDRVSNWLQHFENVVDPYHVPILHGSSVARSSSEQMSAFPGEIRIVRWA